MEFWENLSDQTKASIYGLIGFGLMGIGALSDNNFMLVLCVGAGLLVLVGHIVSSFAQQSNRIAALREEAERSSRLNSRDDEEWSAEKARRAARLAALSYSQQPTPEPPPPSILEVRGHTIYQHAFDAVQVANHTLDTSQPIPIDIGLIVYRGTEKPAIYRTHDVPDDADNIQPYVQLHVPLTLIDTGSARVLFEIVGENDRILFTHEQAYTLKNDLNLITPPARLPIASLDTTDLWELRVSIGDKLIACHPFAWGEPPTEEMVTALEADGEISDEMRALLEEQAEHPLSLDDLLANDDQQKQRGS